MHSIYVPKLNNNDEQYVLGQWLIEDSQPVTAQQEIASVETSKAAVELYSEVSGVFQHVVAAGDQCKYGDVVAYVFDRKTQT
jgi:2-oxoglutarate dehydrogenase E2 component (dihydrolipoamide succinyltransferase)